MKQLQYRCDSVHFFYVAEGEQVQQCPTCGAKCHATGLFKNPDLDVSQCQSRGGHSTIKAINSTIAHRVLFP